MFEEKNTGDNSARADRDLRRGRGRLQFPVRRQGRRLRQQDLPLSGDAVDPDPRPPAGVPEGEDPHARHRRLPALPSRHRHRRHQRGADAEDGEARLDQISRRAADRGRPLRPRLPRSRDGGGASQADAEPRRRRAVRRQVFLPRRARDPPAAPRRLAADRPRRLLLGRPAGAGQDHPRGRVPGGAGARPRALPAACRRGQARRRGRAHRPQAADEGDSRRARPTSDPHPRLADRAR